MLSVGACGSVQWSVNFPSLGVCMVVKSSRACPTGSYHMMKYCSRCLVCERGRPPLSIPKGWNLICPPPLALQLWLPSTLRPPRAPVCTRQQCGSSQASPCVSSLPLGRRWNKPALQSSLELGQFTQMTFFSSICCHDSCMPPRCSGDKCTLRKATSPTGFAFSRSNWLMRISLCCHGSVDLSHSAAPSLIQKRLWVACLKEQLFALKTQL